VEYVICFIFVLCLQDLLKAKAKRGEEVYKNRLRPSSLVIKKMFKKFANKKECAIGSHLPPHLNIYFER
jgi:hypothetical protein